MVQLHWETKLTHKEHSSKPISPLLLLVHQPRGPIHDESLDHAGLSNVQYEMSKKDLARH